MKHSLSILVFILLFTNAQAQTREHRLGFVGGGGSQKYSGDLGNGFSFKNNVWCGDFNARINYYLNRSFDVGVFGSIGDFGYCQPDDVAKRPVDDDDRCPGCVGRVGLGNLNSRLHSCGLHLTYKFANGYLLKENSRIQPYIFAGGAFNYISDRMRMNCVVAGKYYSVNAGVGVKTYLTERINLGYILSFGYFTSDKLDFMSHGKNDMYMQNSLVLGVDLF